MTTIASQFAANDNNKNASGSAMIDARMVVDPTSVSIGGASVTNTNHISVVNSNYLKQLQQQQQQQQHQMAGSDSGGGGVQPLNQPPDSHQQSSSSAQQQTLAERYRVTKKVGDGTFGEVSCAKKLDTGDFVAIKK